MCARRRSNFLLRRLGPVTKEKATPLSVSPSLRYGATCGARFRRGPRKLASLRCAQTVHGPDPPEAALLGTARGDGEPASVRAMATLGLAVGARTAQALGAQCNCRITMQRSETRAQTPIPELQAHRSKPAGALRFLEKMASSAYVVSASSYQKHSFRRAPPAAAAWALVAWWCESAGPPCPCRPPAMPARP